MVGSKVVDLLLEHAGPEVFTNELHDVQLVFESHRVFGQSTEEKSCELHPVSTAGFSLNITFTDKKENIVQYSDSVSLHLLLH